MTDHTHVSDLRFDRLLGSELAGDAKAAVLAEAAACATCTARLAELTRDRDAFAQRTPFVVPRARSQRWWLAAPAVLAVATAIVLVVRGRGDGDLDARPKGGGPHLVLAAGPPGRLAAVSVSDRIHPGDYLQAGYTTDRPGFGAVLSRDGSGKANAYVPSRGDIMIALPAGVNRSFPESTVLDLVVGEEAVVVLWCAAPRPLAPILAELEARGAITAPRGCTDRLIVLDKVAR